MDVSVAAVTAAQAKDAEPVVAIGYEINDVCWNGHLQYKAATRPPLPR
jgi:hypothetical protein